MPASRRFGSSSALREILLGESNLPLELALAQYRSNLELARQVQRGFLPQRTPEVPGYEFFAHLESADKVGGDYYDFIALPRQRVAILLGNVGLNGAVAALRLANLCANARQCLLTEPDAAAAVTRLNSLMNRSDNEQAKAPLIFCPTAGC